MAITVIYIFKGALIEKIINSDIFLNIANDAKHFSLDKNRVTLVFSSKNNAQEYYKVFKNRILERDIRVLLKDNKIIVDKI